MAKAEEPWTQLATRIPKELHRRLKLHCVTNDIALMHFVVEAIEEKLGRNARRCASAIGTGSVDSFGDLAVPRDADAYLCGPTEFMQNITTALVAYGIDRARIRTEIFGAGPTMTPGVVGTTARAAHVPDGALGTGPSVSFARSGRTLRWNSRYGSLLELAEACSVPTRWSCRTGVCHNCESGLLAGAVTYLPDPVESPADGNVLICCSRPRSDVVLDL